MSFRTDEDLSCPICHDIFKDPVVLSCSHSFCKSCVQKWWNGKQACECPYCKQRLPKNDPPRNLALKNLCETFLREREQTCSARCESFCSLHSEKLSLYCLDHKEAVCLICRDSRKHTNHKFIPIIEAAQDHREELQKFLKQMKEKLNRFEQVKGNCDEIEKHVKVQAQHTERLIKEHFKKFYHFLKVEENARITALREEQELKSEKMKEKMDALSREISALSHTTRATEEAARAEDTAFLQNYKATVEKVQQNLLLDDPQLVSGALIDVAKHLGNLTFNIWNKMKHMISYSPVILDPNTADPELAVSEDLSSVRSGEQQQLPTNPERTKFSCSVLGSQGFNSGTHSWDVDVGDNKDWELGMLGEYIQTNKRLQSGLWRMLFSSGKLSAFTASGSEHYLSLKKKLRKIRVHLDFDRGELSFIDLDTMTHIQTFKHTFTDTLFPYIYTESGQSLRILPLKVYVKVEKPI